jgi:hypothetical protein
MEAGEQVTKIKDEYRNLVRVLNNALQEADTCAGYAIEAEATGDSRLADFFRVVQKMHASIVERANRNARRQRRQSIFGRPSVQYLDPKRSRPGRCLVGQDVA